MSEKSPMVTCATRRLETALWRLLLICSHHPDDDLCQTSSIGYVSIRTGVGRSLDRANTSVLATGQSQIPNPALVKASAYASLSLMSVKWTICVDA